MAKRRIPRLAEKKIESLGQFVTFVEREVTYLTIFRGQRYDQPLLPGIARVNLKAELLVSEQIMLRDFRDRSIPLLARTPTSDWEWLAIARHHTLPTRLLDWTENPLIALWFAVEKAALDRKQAVVWCFKTEEEDFAIEKTPFQGSLTKIFRPPVVAERIRSQDGYFSCHRPTKSGKFVPFNKNFRYARNLTKLKIPATCFAKIRSDLDYCGVDRATIFCDLDGLAANIGWRHIWLADEKRNQSRAVLN